MADLRYWLWLSPLLGGCVVRSTLGELDTDGGTTSSPSDADDGTGDGDDDDDASGGLDGSTGSEPEVPPSTDEWVVPEACAAVAAESGYCLTLDHDGPALIGLDTGSVCRFGAKPEQSPFEPSFAWQGMRLVTCNQYAVRIDLRTGEIEESEHECRVLTSIDDRLLVADYEFAGSLELYDDWDALVADAPAQELGFDIAGSRMCTDGEIVLDAWHSTSTVWRHTISGTELDELPLEGHDGWIDGMAMLDGSLLVLTRGDGFDKLLRRFDPGTGASLGALVITDLLIPSGLQCRPGERG